MRSAHVLIAASALALIAGSVIAAPSSSSSTSTPPSSSPPSSSSSSDTAPPQASTGTSANTSATAGGFTVGMPVKDNTGATIGSIADLKTDASGKQAAVIKMGSDQFQVSTSNLGSANGAATINLSQPQIAQMLHGRAGGAGSTSGSMGGGSMGGGSMGGGSTGAGSTGAGSTGGSTSGGATPH